MATVYMLTTTDKTIDLYQRLDFDRLMAAARDDIFRTHTLVEAPKEADIILFVGSKYLDHRDVRAHPLLRRYRSKCFHFHTGTYIIPFLPGVYVNIPKRWYAFHRTVTGFYPKVFALDTVPFVPSWAHCDYLFSFVGSTLTHSVRPRLMTLRHPRACLEDTSTTLMPANMRQTLAMVTYGDEDRRHYGDIVVRSKFVLCPRGYGCSSWRLFETMKAGRVPVIISDQWVPPRGPAWERFSIHVLQKHVAQIPALLERYEPQAASMGRLARAAWEDWFAGTTCFHRTVEWCLQLQQSRPHGRISEVAPYLQLLRPFFVRHALLPDIKQGVRGLVTRRSKKDQVPGPMSLHTPYTRGS